MSELDYGRVVFSDPHFRPAPIAQHVPMPQKPHKCPICQGRGTVPEGFYTGLPLAGTTKCRSCNGRGIVIA